MGCSFKEIPVKDIIHNVQVATLEGKSYDADYAKKWTIKIANEINEKVKGQLVLPKLPLLN